MVVTDFVFIKNSSRLVNVLFSLQKNEKLETEIEELLRTFDSKMEELQVQTQRRVRESEKSLEEIIQIVCVCSGDCLLVNVTV